MITVLLIVLSLLTVGILIGITIDERFIKEKKGDEYWRGYEDGSNSIDELYALARKNGYNDGYNECMEEYNIEESSFKPTPSEFLEQFEEFLNSEDNEEDDYDKGWLSAEKYIKENYTLIPKLNTTDAVNVLEDITEEIDKMKDINYEL